MNNNQAGIKALKELIVNEIKGEFKANRKRNGKWTAVPSYPCPNQVIAERYVKPRGKEEKWSDGHIRRFIPAFENGIYLWKCEAQR